MKLALILLFTLLSSVLQGIQATPPVVAGRFWLSMTINAHGSTIPKGFLDIPIPRNTTMIVTQTARVVRAEGLMDSEPVSYSLEVDEDGNPYVSFSGSGHSGRVRVEVEGTTTLRPVGNIDVSLSGSLDDIPKALANYTSSNDAWNATEEIKALAESMLDRGNVLRTVLLYASWIDGHILYPKSKPHLSAWNASKTFSERVGDCDDRAILFIAMAHSVGIPAYLQIGGIYLKGYNENMLFENGSISYSFVNVGWHGWVVVYVPPWGWVPLDLTFFKGAKSTALTINGESYLQITTDDPLNHIIGAAIYTERVVVVANIVKTDYIGPSEEWLHDLRKNGIRVFEKDVLQYHEVPTSSSTFTPTLTTEEERKHVGRALLFVELALVLIIMGTILAKYRASAKRTRSAALLPPGRG